MNIKIVKFIALYLVAQLYDKHKEERTVTIISPPYPLPVLLLQVMLTLSRRYSAFSPEIRCGLRSTRSKCVSVPPVTTLYPRRCRHTQSLLAFLTICAKNRSVLTFNCLILYMIQYMNINLLLVNNYRIHTSHSK